MKRIDFLLETKLRALVKTISGWESYQILKDKLFFSIPAGVVGPNRDIPFIEIEVRGDLITNKYRTLDTMKDQFCSQLANSSQSDSKYFFVRAGGELSSSGGTEVVMWIQGCWLTQGQYDEYNGDGWLERYHEPQVLGDFMGRVH